MGVYPPFPSFPFLSPSFTEVYILRQMCAKYSECVWQVVSRPLSLILAPWQNPVTCVGGKGEGEGEGDRGREGEGERSKTNERKEVLKATKSLYPHNYVVLREEEGWSLRGVVCLLMPARI